MSYKIIKDTEEIRSIEAMVKSSTEEGVFYLVEGEVSEDVQRWKCSCPAGQHKKYCKHVQEVKEGLFL